MADVQAQGKLVARDQNGERNRTDRRLMLRALELAALGTGLVSPGPLVGCVIANDDGKILGEGSYLYDGVKHAEILALEQVGALARGATAYVSLEPHAHYARTPPCTKALIDAGIARVVAPIEDPNPKVAGAGYTHLRANGIRVDVGLLAKQATKLNEKYLHYARTNRPFVHLKLACSLDGRISTRPGDSGWITGEESRRKVHSLRHEYDAILAGIGTVLADDPLLTDRSGRERRSPLTRVILDDDLRLPLSCKLVRSARASPVLVFTAEHTSQSAAETLISCGVEIERVRRQANPQSVLEILGSRRVQSVLVEGGAAIAGAFCDARLVDKVSFFIAPIILGGPEATRAIAGKGAAAISDAMRLTGVEIAHHGIDVEITGYCRQEEAEA